MKQIIFAAGLYFLLNNYCFSQSQVLSSGDITPKGYIVDYFEELKSDMQGNIFVLAQASSANSFLLKYNGSRWRPVGLDTLGWRYVYDYTIAANNTIYLWAEYAKGTGAKIYKLENNKWDSLPPVSNNARPQRYFMGPDNTLMAFGLFEKGKDNFYVAKWKDGQWWPHAENIKGKFLKNLFANRECRRMYSDKNGNIYAQLYVYAKPTRNYFAYFDGKEWNLLDTAKLSFKSTVRDVVVDSKGQLFVAGFYKDDSKSFCLAQWNGNEWKMLKQSESRMEALAIDSKDNIYFAGELGSYSKSAVNKWSGDSESNFGYADDHFSDIVLSGNAIVSINLGKIYSITEGNHTTKRKPDVVASPQTVSVVKENVPKAEKKDTLAKEVWSIYKDFQKLCNPVAKAYFKSLNSFLEKDASGKFVNQMVWANQSTYVVAELNKFRVCINESEQKFKALKIGQNKNELYDKMLPYLSSLWTYFSASEDFFDVAKSEELSKELSDAYQKMKEAGLKMIEREDKVNETVPQYKRKHLLY